MESIAIYAVATTIIVLSVVVAVKGQLDKSPMAS